MPNTTSTGTSIDLSADFTSISDLDMNNTSASTSASGQSLNLDTTDTLPAQAADVTGDITFDDSSIDAEIELIHRYCENIERNLSSIGLGPPRMSASSVHRLSSDNNDDVIVSASTPVRIRVNTRAALREPVDFIDLSDHEFRAPAFYLPTNDVIDLCTPEGPTLQSNRATPDISIIPPNPYRRRRINTTVENSSTQQGICIINEEESGSSPKRSRDESDDGSYKCPVCLESVRQREPITTKCGHVFCNSCIQAALRTTHKCPLCNKKMTARQISRIYI
ncbi:E3 ubiquitin-protein ligase BRE1A [Scaptodrosophila lebanonensis]|uniref:E3 ubiquitin-protein ligase BRE1A n=1 Tax=Drosophila lebanonensis TaxID=7225 RepID=A0A6J2TMN8_DROLE|nr:E3 ubiquitin-protein ligase BRE1A [Scaptodrosophila lebanonensis]